MSIAQIIWRRPSQGSIELRRKKIALVLRVVPLESGFLKSIEKQVVNEMRWYLSIMLSVYVYAKCEPREQGAFLPLEKQSLLQD